MHKLMLASHIPPGSSTMKIQLNKNGKALASCIPPGQISCSKMCSLMDRPSPFGWVGGYVEAQLLVQERISMIIARASTCRRRRRPRRDLKCMECIFLLFNYQLLDSDAIMAQATGHSKNFPPALNNIKILIFTYCFSLRTFCSAEVEEKGRFYSP